MHVILPYFSPTPSLLLLPPSPSALFASLFRLALAALAVVTASVVAVASVVYL
jgi:hypothetical protein